MYINFHGTASKSRYIFDSVLSMDDVGNFNIALSSKKTFGIDFHPITEYPFKICYNKEYSAFDDSGSLKVNGIYILSWIVRSSAKIKSKSLVL